MTFWILVVWVVRTLMTVLLMQMVLVVLVFTRPRVRSSGLGEGPRAVALLLAINSGTRLARLMYLRSIRVDVRCPDAIILNGWLDVCSFLTRVLILLKGCIQVRRPVRPYLRQCVASLLVILGVSAANALASDCLTYLPYRVSAGL